ncbi:related to HOL1 protein (member of major facilitator superfamily) [Sporisorium reilianum f. sp. reilianum]|uniref:Related to HOL1 protein (Member of major facilitator superfamily) n=1 Tax=Sporisorium reilianum f. sp. reilianum TaxID=72559 RepID=A0A2N8UKN6_9BASI|nr:related to HOL1 protein (member of major facilitator superfamily) [Sporisorium reilianum f. sp. reilianum]
MALEREPSLEDSVEEKDQVQGTGLTPMYYSVDEAGKPTPSNNAAVRKISTLGATAGTVKNVATDGDIILLPTPTNDVNDPLNWSRAYKWYMTCIVCLGAFMSNLTTAGPSIAIIQTGMTFRTAPTTTAYLYSCAALMLGFSMFWWSPLASKFGKRPIYVFTYIVYCASCFAAGGCKTFGAQLAVRIIMGATAGAGEMLGPITINDIWFLHERATPIAAYNAFLSVGVAFGAIIDGAIINKYPWQYIYWINGSIIAIICILVTFTFPETSYRRPALETVTKNQHRHIDVSNKKTWVQNLSLYSGVWIQESFLTLFMRPWLGLMLPAVAWAAFVWAVSVGFMVAVSSNVALAFGMTYHFGPLQVAYCWFAGVIASLLGLVGGPLADRLSHRSVIRNGGIREPEMRLPAAFPSIITATLGLVLYGVGIHFRMHWIVPTLGIAFSSWTIVAGTAVALVYAVDSYKPISEEVVTCILGYKALFGFLLAFYTNKWVMNEGYLNAFGEMAAISGTAFLLGIPMWIWGKRMRQASLNWKVFRVIRWNSDRDDLILEDE